MAPSQPPEGSGGDAWNDLPGPVRRRLARVAAAAVPELTAAELPERVRPLARFAPAKRAHLGESALVTALRQAPAFRTAVVEWASQNQPDSVEPAAPDPPTAAAAALLLGRAGADEQVHEVARHTEDADLRAERDAAHARERRLAGEVDRLRRQLSEASTDSVADSEADRLRARLREQGVALRQARDEAKRAGDAQEAKLAELRQAVADLRAERDRDRERVEALQDQLDRARADIETARQSAREARQADELRLTLLLQTLSRAVDGLRRELALGGALDPSSPRPADLVADATPPGAGGEVLIDVRMLDRLLRLPAAHLIVDGYNVTKTGYPELALAEQRQRLAGQLSALAARTSAEVTVVFDGAAVVSAAGTSPRGVRVLFSDPGVSADDVIRSVVTAEPTGRVTVVATSDRELAGSVRPAGAYTVAADVLLERLGRS